MMHVRHGSMRKTLKEPNRKPQRYLARSIVAHFAAASTCRGTHDLNDAICSLRK